MMSVRPVTLFGWSIAGLVAYKYFSKLIQEAQLQEELQSIALAYLQKLKKDPKNKKSLTEKCRNDIDEFEKKGPTALNLVCSTFGCPPNNEFGILILEMLNEWNSIAYDAMCDKIEEISSSKIHKVSVCEIGPGAGDGMEKVLKRFEDRLEYIHGYDISLAAISLIHRRFAKQIRNNQIAIEYANICDEHDLMINHRINDNVQKYDIVFHINCFYFWDNLRICGKRLSELLHSGGYIIGGFRWNYLASTPKNIYKNRKQSAYLNMLKQSRDFDMDTVQIFHQVGGDKAFQIITVQKK